MMAAAATLPSFDEDEEDELTLNFQKLGMTDAEATQIARKLKSLQPIYGATPSVVSRLRDAIR